jgi:hypothetical protein
MHNYLIQCSHHATRHNSKWDAATFDSIAWQPLGNALCPLSIGQ